MGVDINLTFNIVLPAPLAVQISSVGKEIIHGHRNSMKEKVNLARDVQTQTKHIHLDVTGVTAADTDCWRRANP